MTNPATQLSCPHCGGTDLVQDILVRHQYEPGPIGLIYQKRRARIFVIRQAEPLLADLCSGCGTVARFHVRTTDRPWKTE